MLVYRFFFFQEVLAFRRARVALLPMKSCRLALKSAILVLRRVFDPIREYSSVSIKRGSHKVRSEGITTTGTSASLYGKSYDDQT